MIDLLRFNLDLFSCLVALLPCHYFEHMSTNFLWIVVVRLTNEPQSVRRQYATIILIAEILLKLFVLRIFNLLHDCSLICPIINIS